MSQQDRELEDVLRWTLRSTADSVEPSQDGLERIRSRLTAPYPLPVAWMMAVYSQAARWTRGGLSSLGTWLAAVPSPARQRRRVTRPSPSRRPSRVAVTAALAGTALAVAIGVGALAPPVRHAIVQTGLLIRSITSGDSGSTSRQSVSGHGGKSLPNGGAPSTGSQQTNSANCATQQAGLATTPTSPATSATTTASPSPTVCATLTTGPTATSPSLASGSSPTPTSPSPSPTPTSPSPSPTPTSPSPSPTPTSSSPSPTPTSSSPSPTPTSSSPSPSPTSSSPSPIPSATAGPEKSLSGQTRQQ
jgi:hypothetical protein